MARNWAAEESKTQIRTLLASPGWKRQLWCKVLAALAWCSPGRNYSLKTTCLPTQD